MSALVSWRDVTLTDGTRNLSAEDPEATRALRELRERDTMSGFWACSADELEDEDADDSKTGLGAKDIDWSGFGESAS